MTQENKDFLLKDLCARLPYGVKIETLDGPQKLDIKWLSINMCNIESPYLPYLFPISSMTEEQKEEFNISIDMGYASAYNEEINCANRMVDFFNKYHFDYRGLIDKGLAIDCTNLNIY